MRYSELLECLELQSNYSDVTYYNREFSNSRVNKESFSSADVNASSSFFDIHKTMKLKVTNFDTKEVLSVLKHIRDTRDLLACECLISVIVDTVDHRYFFEPDAWKILDKTQTVIIHSLRRVSKVDDCVQAGDDALIRAITNKTPLIIVLNTPSVSVVKNFVSSHLSSHLMYLSCHLYSDSRISQQKNKARILKITDDSEEKLNGMHVTFKEGYDLLINKPEIAIFLYLMLVQALMHISDSDCDCKGKSFKCCVRKTMLQVLSLQQQHVLTLSFRNCDRNEIQNSLTNCTALLNQLRTLRIKPIKIQIKLPN